MTSRNYVESPYKPGYIELMDEARAFVASLDRTAFGALAVADADLTYVYALRTVPMDEQYILYQSISTRGTPESIAAGGDISDDRNKLAMFELMYWFINSDDPVINAHVGLMWSKGTAGFEVLQRFDTIRENPHAHSYFAADIWDLDFITRCIADGIDADLAATLVVTA